MIFRPLFDLYYIFALRSLTGVTIDLVGPIATIRDAIANAATIDALAVGARELGGQAAVADADDLRLVDGVHLQCFLNIDICAMKVDRSFAYLPTTLRFGLLTSTLVLGVETPPFLLLSSSILRFTLRR